MDLILAVAQTGVYVVWTLVLLVVGVVLSAPVLNVLGFVGALMACRFVHTHVGRWLSNRHTARS